MNFPSNIVLQFLRKSYTNDLHPPTKQLKYLKFSPLYRYTLESLMNSPTNLSQPMEMESLSDQTMSHTDKFKTISLEKKTMNYLSYPVLQYLA